MKRTIGGRVGEPQPNQSKELVTRMRRIADAQFEFWIEHGPDREYGGFHGQLDRQGQPTGNGDKGLIQHSRHLWAFSTWYERRDASQRVRTIARDLYQYIVTRFSDATADGFFRKVTRNGNVTEPVHQVYPEAFAVFALATYGRVFGEAEAIDRALRCFRCFDDRAHEPRFGGYDLTGDPPWQTPGANRDTNTHIHVMEALTALGEVSRDELVHVRLREFTEITLTKLRQPGNYAHLELLFDYTPLGDPVISYGHDLEISWLALDAVRVLHAGGVVAPLPKSIRELALEMGRASALEGFDGQRGGYYYAGIPGGGVTDHEKVWWVQFEALPALVKLHATARLGSALQQLASTLDWIETHQTDLQYGGVYWGVLPDGTLGNHGDIKGDPWKASYHDLRALLFAADWLEHGMPV